MFDSNEFMNSVTLRTVWRAGNQQTISVTEEIDLPKICTSIHGYLDSIEFQSSKVPLRTLSVLIDGATKLYKSEVISILQECYELDMQMAIRKTGVVKLDTESNEGSDVPNDNLERSSLSVSYQDHSEEHSEIEKNCGTSSSRRKRHERTSNNFHNKKRKCTGLSADSSEETEQNTGDFVLNQEHVNGNNETPIELNSPLFEDNEQMQEKGVQTNKSYISRRERSINTNRRTFDEHLPFGFVMIFDNYNDRFPSKIIYSSLNSRVKNL